MQSHRRIWLHCWDFDDAVHCVCVYNIAIHTNTHNSNHTPNTQEIDSKLNHWVYAISVQQIRKTKASYDSANKKAKTKPSNGITIYPHTHTHCTPKVDAIYLLVQVSNEHSIKRHSSVAHFHVSSHLIQIEASLNVLCECEIERDRERERIFEYIYICTVVGVVGIYSNCMHKHQTSYFFMCKTSHVSTKKSIITVTNFLNCSPKWSHAVHAIHIFSKYTLSLYIRKAPEFIEYAVIILSIFKTNK